MELNPHMSTLPHKAGVDHLPQKGILTTFNIDLDQVDVSDLQFSQYLLDVAQVNWYRVLTFQMD